MEMSRMYDDMYYQNQKLASESLYLAYLNPIQWTQFLTLRGTDLNPVFVWGFVPIVQRINNAIHQINYYPAQVMSFALSTHIHWMVIYQMESIMNKVDPSV